LGFGSPRVARCVLQFNLSVDVLTG